MIWQTVQQMSLILRVKIKHGSKEYCLHLSWKYVKYVEYGLMMLFLSKGVFSKRRLSLCCGLSYLHRNTIKTRAQKWHSFSRNSPSTAHQVLNLKHNELLLRQLLWWPWLWHWWLWWPGLWLWFQLWSWGLWWLWILPSLFLWQILVLRILLILLVLRFCNNLLILCRINYLGCLLLPYCAEDFSFVHFMIFLSMLP